MILDRSKAPEFKIPEDFELLPPLERTLSNGSKFFYIPTPGLNAVKIEVMGKGRRTSLPLVQTLVPMFTLQMLHEGTKQKTARELAEFFDFYATQVYSNPSFSHEGLGLLSTKKHIFTVLDVFLSMFSEATFPPEMLEKRKSLMKLSIQVEHEKTASRANQVFKKCLFGATHPYGVIVQETHVDAVSRDLLLDYYNHMLWQDLEVFVVGDFDSQELDRLLSLFGQLPNRIPTDSVLLPNIDTLLAVKEPKEKSVQSSVRIGHCSVSKKHEDFIPLTVFNTILGGYFGSRLIKNIREDKGHTYGIYSALAEVIDSNYWVIAADVQKAYYPEVIKEIYHEIRLLTEEEISSDELEVVRNYLIGKMLMQFSTPFDLLDGFQAVHRSGLALDYYSQKLAYLKTFSAEDILTIGRKYFSNPPFIEVVVG
ncbi:insulinase family protein [Algoriphagus sp. AGSA1]|uniref:M16 family metallopeptidase n=1 Tax=Algoriphagus sp. AGSA1 TaxID=2907213 RepID=UPI001F1F1BA7|nr:pitrilysin family protein [Algoriphagus sp. AGSA1]MCE7053310.1 insulinase family protein [Algoriphagus sp. AGSA1]